MPMLNSLEGCEGENTRPRSGHAPGRGDGASPMSEPARVLLFSQRGLSPQLSRCFLFEMEDAIAALDEVDLLAPEYRVPRGELVLGELGYRVAHSAGRRIGLVRGVNPPLTTLPVERD